MIALIKLIQSYGSSPTGNEIELWDIGTYMHFRYCINLSAVVEFTTLPNWR